MESVSSSSYRLSPFGSSPAASCELRNFQQNVERTVEQFYRESNFEGLLPYVESQIEILDRLTDGNYAIRAREVVRQTIQSVPAKVPEGLSKYLDQEHCIRDDNPACTYTKCFGMLIFTKSVVLYRHDEYSHFCHLDYLLLSYDLYNALYLALIDCLCDLNDWDTGINALIELGVILYFIRVDLCQIVEQECSKTESDNSISPSKEQLNEPIFLNRGIYLEGASKAEDNEDIAGHVLAYWMNELQLEIWSRVVLLWLHDSSLYNVLETLESLHLHLRYAIIRGVRLFVFPDKITSGINETAEKGKATQNVHIPPFNPIIYRKRSRDPIAYRRLLTYLCSTSSNYRRYAFEGCLMIAQLSRDINYELYTNLCFLVYMVARIVSSQEIFANCTSVGIAGCCVCSGASDSDYKNKTQHLCHTCLILRYASAHHRVNRRVSNVPSSIDCIWLKSDETWRRLDLRPLPTVVGFTNCDGHLCHTLEHLIMLEVDRAILYEGDAIDNVSFVSRADDHHLLDESLEKLQTTSQPEESGLKYGCERCLHIENVVLHDRSVEMRFNFNRLCSHLPLRNKRKGITVLPKGASTKLSLHKLAKCLDSVVEPMVEGCDVKLIFALIAFCFTVDRQYTILHFKQSLEFLNYKDTLRKKQKMFIRKILPWVPVVNSEETRKILSFQRLIKTVFYSKLKKAFYLAVEESHGLHMHAKISSFQRTLRETTELKGYRLRNHTGIPLIGKDVRILQHKMGATYSSLKTRLIDAVDRTRNSISAAKGFLYKGYDRYKPLYDDRRIRMGHAKFLGDQRHTLSDNCESVPQIHCKSSCDHTGVQPCAKGYDISFKHDSFRQLSRMMLLLDWIAHYIFTGSLTQESVRPQRLPDVDVVRLDSTQSSHYDDDTPVSTYEDDPDNVDKRVSTSGYGSSYKVVAQRMYSNKPNHISDPLGLLNEIVESTVLISLATFFHEHHHNRLLLRLAILQVLKGRWNLSLALMKQIKGTNSGYKTPFRDRSLCSRYDTASCLTNVEQKFIFHLTAKILIELVHEPQLAIHHILSKMEDGPVRDSSGPLESDRSNPLDDVKNTNSERDMSGVEALILGVSYLQLGDPQVVDVSLPMSDFDRNMLHLDHPELESVKFIECESTGEYIGNHSAGSSNNSQGLVETNLAIGTEYILRSVSIDPNNFKAWAYLAHCGVRAHDFYFAYQCSQRSIECYDACLSGWLTMAVVLSTRNRSCAPIPVSTDVWCKYLVNKKRSQNGACDKPLSSLTLPSIPVPFDPVLPLGTSTEADLHYHVNRAVGGDVSECLNVLVSSTRFGSVFTFAAILQISARLSDACVYSFPWEGSCAILSTNEILNNVVSLLKASIGGNYPQKAEYINNSQVDHDPAKVHVIMKNLVSKATAESIFVSSVPFIRYMVLVFSLDVMDDASHFSSVSGDTGYFDGRIHVPCVEEVYGWLTCLEILSQYGQATAAQIMYPLMEAYLNVYRSQGQEFEHFGFSTDVKPSAYLDDICRSGETKRHFGDRPLITTDLTTEATFLNLYIRCFVTKDEELENLLADVQHANTQCYSRKLRLLECRLLASLCRHSESALQFDALLRRGFICDPSTDYLFEYQAMKVYASVLREMREFDKAASVDAFAEQCYLSTPVLKCDLCLVDPL